MTTAALRRVWASAPKNELLLECLSLTHSGFSKSWHITNSAKAFVGGSASPSGAVLFEPMPFVVKLPASDAQGGQLLDIAIANAGRDMVAEVEAASRNPQERIQVEYRVFVTSDLAASQITPIRLSIDSVSMTTDVITATAGRSDVLNQPFPAIYYRPEQFPGLRR